MYNDVGCTASTHPGKIAQVLGFIFIVLCVHGDRRLPSFVEDMKVFQEENLKRPRTMGAGHFHANHTFHPSIFLIGCQSSGMIGLFPVGLKRGIWFGPQLPNGIITGAGLQALMILAAAISGLPKELPKAVLEVPDIYIDFQRLVFLLVEGE
nr:ABC transporter G family member 11-like [Ipomoea batatas]